MDNMTIEDAVHAQGYPEEVAVAVLDHIAELGTADAIMRGERTLPGKQDAERWFQSMIDERKRLEQLTRRTGGN